MDKNIFLISLIFVFFQISFGQKPELFLQTGQQGEVIVEFSSNGQFFVSEGRSEIKIHDARTGTELRSFVQDSNCSGGFAISPDSQILAGCGKDGKTFLWKIQTGEVVASFEGGRSLSFNATGDKVRVFDGRESQNFDISTKTLTEDKSFDFESISYADLSALSPNGKIFAVASKSEVKNKLIYLINSNAQIAPLILQGHSAAVEDLIFSPDNRFLASYDEKGTVRLWTTETGKPVLDFNCNPNPSPLLGFPIVFSFDSKMLLTTCETETTRNVSVWNTETGAKTKTFLIHSENDFKFFDRHFPVSLSLHPDNQTLLVGRSGGEIKMYEFDDGEAIRLLNAKITRNRVNSFGGDFDKPGTPLAISPDGKTLANGGGDFGVRFWDLAESGGFKSSRVFYDLSSRKELEYYHNAPFAFSPNGKEFLCERLGEIITVDLASGKSKVFFTDPRRTVKTIRTAKDDKLSFQINALAYSPNGARVAVKASLALVDEETPSKEYVYLLDAKTGGIIYQVTRKGFSNSAALAFSPDSKLLAVNDGRDGILLWNTQTGKIAKTLKKKSTELFDDTDEEPTTDEELPANDYVSSLTFSSDGRFLAVGTTNSLEMWSVVSGDLLKDTAEETDESEIIVSSSSVYQTSVESVAFSPVKRLFAIGKGDGSIQLVAFRFNEDEGVALSKVFEMQGHTGSIVTVAFSADGTKIFSSSDDTTIKIWNAADGKLLATLAATSPRDWLVVTPDGLFDGSASSWQKVFWRFNQDTFDYAPTEAFFREYYYPGLLGEIMQGNPPRPPDKDLSNIDIRQPTVKIISVNGRKEIWQNTGTVAQKTVPIEIEVTDNTNRGQRKEFSVSSGARDLRLFRNGSLVRIWRGNVFELGEKDGCTQIPATPDYPRKTVCQAQVSITADDNRFYGYVFNDNNVKSADSKQAYLLGAESLKKDATMYILAVGVNEYANPAFNLKYAVADVEAIGKELSLQQSKFSGKSYSETKVITLTNSQATKANIFKALKKFSGENIETNQSVAELEKIKQAQPEDALIIYFAGHGLANKDRFYLIPHDGIPTDFAGKITADAAEQKRLLVQGKSVGDQNGLNQLFKQSISDLELEDLLENVNAGKLMMVIDACNSGQALEAEEKRRGPMNSRGLAQLAYEKGMNILTASQSFQAAIEASSLNHGLLTFALLEGLRKGDANGDKSIIDREWLDYGVSAVPQLQIEARNKRLLTQNKETNSTEKDTALQTPRVFYRRESDFTPLVIASQ